MQLISDVQTLNRFVCFVKQVPVDEIAACSIEILWETFPFILFFVGSQFSNFFKTPEKNSEKGTVLLIDNQQFSNFLELV